MTIEEFFSIVHRLANAGYCRYWLNWPLIKSDRQVMVVALINILPDGKVAFERIGDSGRHGFIQIQRDDGVYYAVERTEN